MPEQTRDSATDESTQQGNTIEPFELVAVDFCYKGSTVDPTTGEVVDLYVMCTGDGVEQNLDIA
jgi:hypothetical protein